MKYFMIIIIFSKSVFILSIEEVFESRRGHDLSHKTVMEELSLTTKFLPIFAFQLKDSNILRSSMIVRWLLINNS